MNVARLEPPPPEREGDPTATLGGALHEVSNSLTVVLGWLEAARLEASGDAVTRALDIACAHARRGHCIARRAIGAPAADERDSSSIRDLVYDALVGVEREALRAGISVCEQTSGAGEGFVEQAPQALQVLLNLLLNAIAFTPAGGQVVLRVEWQDGALAFTVQDQGPGIPEERISALFDGPGSTRRGGAGIGLRHSAALAESCGGELRLLHAGPGAQFQLRWAAAEAASRSRPRPHPASALAGKALVVLEDDPALAELMALGLGARGAHVATISRPEDIASVVQAQGTPDAILLDLSPLGPDPTAAVGSLRQRFPTTPLIVTSGCALAPSPELAALVSGWIRKPFELAELHDTLGTLLMPTPCQNAISRLDSAER